METKTSDTQVRAARELLRWDQKRLAKESGASLTTVKRFENGLHVGEPTVADLIAALEKAGVLFIGPTTVNGIEIAGAVALRAWATPDARPETRTYTYKKGIKPGRPPAKSAASKAKAVRPKPKAPPKRRRGEATSKG